MAFLLRVIDKRRWDWVEEDIQWLTPGDFPAAPLADLKTSVQSKLSVWHIADNLSNLESVIAAHAATRMNADKLDYTVFNEELLVGAGIRTESTPGNTPDSTVNARWHADLIELTSSKIVELARLIYQYGNHDRTPESRVKQLIAHAVEEGRIDNARLNDGLRSDVFTS